MQKLRQAILKTPVASLVTGAMLGAAALGTLLYAEDTIPSTMAAPVLYDEG